MYRFKLTILLFSIFVGFSGQHSAFAQTFEDFKKERENELKEFKEGYTREYEEFARKEREGIEKLKRELAAYWGENDTKVSTQKEWVEYTKQIWNISIPNKSDLAFGKHTAIMPEAIVERCVRLFSYVDDMVLDPFAGSGTTLKVVKELKRNFVGYEIMREYEKIINIKLKSVGA